MEATTLTPKKRGVIPEMLIPQPRGGTLALLSGSNLVGDNRNPRVGMMSVLAFELVYFAGLTSNDLLGGVVSLLACLVLFNVMAKDSPNQ